MSTTSFVQILFGTNLYFLELCICPKPLYKNIQLYFGLHPFNNLLDLSRKIENKVSQLLWLTIDQHPFTQAFKGYTNQCDETIFSALNASRQLNEILLFLCTQTYYNVYEPRRFNFATTRRQNICYKQHKLENIS